MLLCSISRQMSWLRRPRDSSSRPLIRVSVLNSHCLSVPELCIYIIELDRVRLSCANTVRRLFLLRFNIYNLASFGQFHKGIVSRPPKSTNNDAAKLLRLMGKLYNLYGKLSIPPN